MRTPTGRAKTTSMHAVLAGTRTALRWRVRSISSSRVSGNGAKAGLRRSLAIRIAATRTLVGGCETRVQSDRSAEVSWWIFPEYRRQGLATRGVGLMLHYFTNTVGVSKFVALIEPDNHGSRGVARNMGFIESGLDTSG